MNDEVKSLEVQSGAVLEQKASTQLLYIDTYGRENLSVCGVCVHWVIPLRILPPCCFADLWFHDNWFLLYDCGDKVIQ